MRITTPPRNVSRRADATTMRAIVQRRFGTTDAWELTDAPVPTIGPDEVLVQVGAAGVDRGTWHLMTGRPFLLRAIGFGFRGPRNVVPGLATAGTVVGVGAAVDRFSVGDRVYGVSRGAYAELAAAPADKLGLVPAGLTFEQAAAVPVSATSALQAVQLGRVVAGHRVMVLGASGGVGTFAVQIAKALGAEVTAVCHASKVDLVRAIGADHTVDHTTQDPTDGAHRDDVILDLGGSTPLRRLRRALTPDGTLVIVGGEGGGSWTGGFGRSLRAPLWSLVVGQRLTALTSHERHPSLDEVSDLIRAGAVTPVVDRAFPLERADAAMHRLEAGQARGKLVVTI